MKSDKEHAMKLFTCKVCKQKYCDTKLYFYGTKSEKCMWCTKFPKKKNDRQFT